MAGEESIALFIIFGCLVFAVFTVAFIIFAIRYQSKMYEKEKRIRDMNERYRLQLFASASQAEEAERERIALNLHDEISPLLTVLRQNIQRHRIDILKHRLDLGKFDSDFELIDKVAEGLRSSSFDLVPTFLLQNGLVQSLAAHMAGIDRAAKVTATFTNISPAFEGKDLPKGIQLNIYRATLEVINNILRHSGCTGIELVVSLEQNTLVLTFTHNGIGVSNEEIDALTRDSAGLGLRSLKARVLLLGGSMEYIKGEELSDVCFKIPLKDD